MLVLSYQRLLPCHLELLRILSVNACNKILTPYVSVAIFLQDPSDKRRILCDDKLKELFEVDSFHGFTMTKHLTAHFIKADGR